MKINVKQVDRHKRVEYPYLGIDANGQVVLFIFEGEGVYFNGELAINGRNQGYNDNIPEDSFEVFAGEVVLSNN